jgi:putative Ca2+/H+ antiporter (TMEM165/GDT1 family)
VKSYLVVFVSVLLAELGDKTQLATLLFATDPALSRLGVFVAAAGALVTASLLAVLLGAWIGSWVAPGQLRILAGVGFVVVGLWVLLARP